jgi:hypothetical protein
MTNVELIKLYLPQELHEKAGHFSIPDEFLKRSPDLIILVLNSKSMDKDEEKQNRFNLLPLMNEEQIARLRDILTREKQKLSEIEQKYQEKKEEIKNKYVKRFEAIGYEKAVSKMKAIEEGVEKKEDQEADALLQNI